MNDVSQKSSRGGAGESNIEKEKKSWKDRERCWPSRKCKSWRDCERKKLTLRLRLQEQKVKYGRCIKWGREEGGKVKMERPAADRASRSLKSKQQTVFALYPLEPN